MLFKIAICDDEEKDCTILSEYLRQYEMQYDIDFQINCYANGAELLSAYHSGKTFHVLFLDVEMPGLSGLELAREIRNLPERQVRIIFVSNYPQYMQDSFNVQAFHYLTKPLSYDTFCHLINNIQKDYIHSASTKLLLCSDLTEEFVFIDDIIYIKTSPVQKGYLTFVLKEKSLLVKGYLHYWETELAPYSFLSPYRGILVNLDHIHFFEKGKLLLSNNHSVPLSRRHEQRLREAFSRHVITIHHYR